MFEMRSCRLAAALLLALAMSAAGTVFAQQDKTFELAIEGRKLVGGEATLQAAQGDHVTLRWRSDEAVELHLHGYDIELDLAAGEPGVLAFDAQYAGRFPVTAHGFGGAHDHSEQPLVYLEVYPQ